MGSTTEVKPRRIVVTGDLLKDHYVLRHPMTLSSYYEPFSREVFKDEDGGASYLKQLIDQACSDIQPIPQIDLICPEGDEGVSHAYTVWSLHDEKIGGERKALRIKEFLGCKRALPKAPPMIPLADILVFDDLGLGFSNLNIESFLKIESLYNIKDVVLKTSRRPDDNELFLGLMPLLKAVTQANGAHEGPSTPKLTVVISANLLRARGAAISQGLSWDQTIEDTVCEFETGRSKQDLALCNRVVVRFGTAGVAYFVGPGDGSRHVTLKHFLYHPCEQEGDWEQQHPGQIFGATSIITAALVRHILEPGSFPIFLSLGRALRAARIIHEEGAGIQESGTKENPPFKPNGAFEKVAKALHRKPKDENAKGQPEEPASIFFTAFPHELLSDPTLRHQAASQSDLLRDVTGAGIEYIAAGAADVVLRGARRALRGAPMVCYGDFVTVDRDEIERINVIRRLAETYLNNPLDRRPLSIAVFGPPGSGKSFAIKELAKYLFREKREPLRINLAQFGKKDIQLLKEAFHRVRDASVQGQVPLVFWDEFDADGLFWLKFFLAPMQDSEFRSGSLVYPLGKAIFVFAGGTQPTFEDFIAPLYKEAREGSDEQEKADSEFRKNKGPDFVSRLRGYMNVKGPNPMRGDRFEDPAYLIRHTILLRGFLEHDYPHLILEDGTALVSPSVIQGFLRVKDYLHETRSLESLIRASDLKPSRHYFEPSQLPPKHSCDCM